MSVGVCGIEWYESNEDRRGRIRKGKKRRRRTVEEKVVVVVME